jgi:hypothetical protein
MAKLSRHILLIVKGEVLYRLVSRVFLYLQFCDIFLFIHRFINLEWLLEGGVR